MSERIRDGVYGQSDRKDTATRLLKFQERVDSSKTRSKFKRIKLYEDNTLLGTTYEDSKIFDARLYKAPFLYLKNTNATLGMKYKVLACIDPDFWKEIVAETDLAAQAVATLSITDAWAFIKVQAKAEEFGVVGKCFSHTTEGDAWIDETTDANSAATNDVKLPPHSNYPSDRRDYIYYGSAAQFTSLAITIENGSEKDYPDNPLMKWEYWNGSAWTALEDVVDETDGSRDYGVAMEVNYTLPSDWAKNAVHDETYYWIRFGGYANQSSSAPTATQIWLAGAKASVKGFLAGK